MAGTSLRPLPCAARMRDGCKAFSAFLAGQIRDLRPLSRPQLLALSDHDERAAQRALETSSLVLSLLASLQEDLAALAKPLPQDSMPPSAVDTPSAPTAPARVPAAPTAPPASPSHPGPPAVSRPSSAAVRLHLLRSGLMQKDLTDVNLVQVQLDEAEARGSLLSEEELCWHTSMLAAHPAARHMPDSLPPTPVSSLDLASAPACSLISPVLPPSSAASPCTIPASHRSTSGLPSLSTCPPAPVSSAAAQSSEPSLTLPLTLQSLQAAVAAAPQDAGCLYALASHVDSLGDSQAARSYYESLIALDPGHFAARLGLATLLKAAGDYDQALQHYEAAAQAHPGDPSVCFNAALLCKNHLNDPLQARSWYEAALVADPGHVNSHYNLALLCQNALADYPAAQAHYTAALRITPNDAEAEHSLALLLHHHFGDFQGARTHYGLAVAADPSYQNSHYNLAHLLDSHFQDYPAARMHYEAVLQLDPGDTATRHSLAFLLDARLGDHGSAAFHYEASLAINPADVDTLYNLAGLYCQMGRHRPARDLYEAALGLLGSSASPASPSDNAAYLLCEQQSEHQGSDAQPGPHRAGPLAGLRHLRLSWTTLAVHVHHSLARLLHGHLNEPAGAAWHYREAIRLDSCHTESYYQLATLLASRLSDPRGHPSASPGAADAFRAVIRLDPAHPTAQMQTVVGWTSLARSVVVWSQPGLPRTVVSSGQAGL
eukprot:gene1400-2764_t